MIKSLVCALIVISKVVGLGYVFDVGVEPGFIETVPLYKNKGVGYDVTEDSGTVSETSLTVADGVGGYKFPSSHMARLVSAGTLPVFSKGHQLEHEEFREELISVIYDLNKKYDEVIERQMSLLENNTALLQELNPQQIQKLNELLNSNKKDQASLLAGGTTMINASLTEAFYTEEPIVKFTHIGDSLGLIMSLECQAEGTGCFYYPKHLTKDDQLFFNAPGNLSSNKKATLEHMSVTKCDKTLTDQELFDFMFKNYMESEIKTTSFGVKEGDLVIVASDGFFDNLPLNVITVLINFYFKWLGTEPRKELDFGPTLESFVGKVIEQQDKYINHLLFQYRNIDFKGQLQMTIQNEKHRQKQWLKERCEDINKGPSLTEQFSSSLVSMGSTMFGQLGSIMMALGEQEDFRSSQGMSYDIGEMNRMNDFDEYEESGFVYQKSKSFIDDEVDKIQIDNPHTFKRRILAGNGLFDACSIDRLFRKNPAYADTYTVEMLPSCIKNTLKTLFFNKSTLSSLDYKHFSISLSKAAKTIATNENMKISPFSLNGLDFGYNTPGTKDDDIGVIGTIIKAKSEAGSTNNHENWAQQSIDSILADLQRDIPVFIKNKIKK